MIQDDLLQESKVTYFSPDRHIAFYRRPTGFDDQLIASDNGRHIIYKVSGSVLSKEGHVEYSLLLGGFGEKLRIKDGLNMKPVYITDDGRYFVFADSKTKKPLYIYEYDKLTRVFKKRGVSFLSGKYANFIRHLGNKNESFILRLDRRFLKSDHNYACYIEGGVLYCLKSPQLLGASVKSHYTRVSHTNDQPLIVIKANRAVQLYVGDDWISAKKYLGHIIDTYGSGLSYLKFYRVDDFALDDESGSLALVLYNTSIKEHVILRLIYK